MEDGITNEHRKCMENWKVYFFKIYLTPFGHLHQIDSMENSSSGLWILTICDYNALNIDPSGELSALMYSPHSQS